MRCLAKEARLREGEGLARAHTAAQAHSPQGEQRAEKPTRGSCGHWASRTHAFPGPPPRMRTRADSRGAGSQSGLSGMSRSPGLGGAGGAAGGGGSEARLCAGGGGRTRESHPPRPPQDPPPSADTRCALSALQRSPGAGEAGGIPEGIPSPPPAARRPGTHVSARPARIPPAAQRVLARHPCLRRPGPHAGTALSLAGPRCPSRALGGAPAPATGTQRTGRGAAPDAGESGHHGPHAWGRSRRRRAGGIPGGFGPRWGQAGGAPSLAARSALPCPLEPLPRSPPGRPAELPAVSYPARVSLPPPRPIPSLCPWPPLLGRLQLCV